MLYFSCMARRKQSERADVEIKSKEREQRVSPETKNAILSVVLFALGGLVVLAYLDNAGVAGEFIKKGALALLGEGSFLLPLAAFAGGLSLVVSLKQERHHNLAIGIPLAVLTILAAFDILKGDAVLDFKPGGWIGWVAAWPLLKLFGQTASIVVVLAILVAAFLVAFDTGWPKFWKRGQAPDETEDRPAAAEEPDVVFEPSPFLGHILGWLKRNPDKKEAGPAEEDWATHAVGSKALPKPHSLDGVVPRNQPAEKAAPRGRKKQASLFSDGYEPPPLTFLEEGKDKPSSGDIAANRNIIKRTLAEFGIKVELGEVNVGPSITQYLIKPSSGVNVSRITALRKNLSLALAAHPLRIEAPIPGKPYVGIEVPNKAASAVRLRLLIDELYKVTKDKPEALVFPLGRDVTGQPVFADLAKMPHLLIAGATGSGKSVAVNNILVSLLYKHSPQRLKFLLVDPKRVELTPYNDIPHLLSPVVVDAKKAINVLRWAVSEMERRYKVLAEVGARDIVSYNKKVEDAEGDDILPYIIVVIDEMADLMAMYKKEVEAAVVRLAQMARAVGLHLIASTQRPSTDVVTGLIKANIPVRIAFKVASQVDSRTILDQAGAEKLLGYGDLLYMSGDSSGLKRIQGVYVTEPEVRRVTNYLKTSGPAAYNESITKEHRSTALGNLSAQNHTDEPLYEEAKQLAIDSHKLSASLLQRRLRVGYARAARLLDLLEERGIIGPADGAKPREVLVDKEPDEFTNL